MGGKHSRGTWASRQRAPGEREGRVGCRDVGDARGGKKACDRPGNDAADDADGADDDDDDGDATEKGRPKSPWPSPWASAGSTPIPAASSRRPSWPDALSPQVKSRPCRVTAAEQAAPTDKLTIRSRCRLKG
jgi:hypothetical protein